MTVDDRLPELINHCEQEQLHLSGAIQAFGALLRIDRGSEHITHASANLPDFLGRTAAEVMGLPIADLKLPLAGAIAALPSKPGERRLLVNAVQGPAGWLDVHLCCDGGGVIVELEPTTDTRLAPVDVHRLQAELMILPGTQDAMTASHQRIVDTVRGLTGFDRVMLYRFHDDWSGEVIAEATRPAAGSYLGLRFPASDIPAIARNLYSINPTRTIPDVDALPVPVLGLEGAVPDLTWSDLRSVSPVHIEYLKHMDVAASFSVPIKVAGKLWGLVACHHMSPHYISSEYRQHCAGLVHTYALTLTAFNANRRLQLIDSMELRIDQALESIAGESDPRVGLVKHRQLILDLVDADGMALVIGNDLLKAGATPEDSVIGEIDRRFVNQDRDLFFANDHLVEWVPAETLGDVAGALGIKTSSARSGVVRLYWFRQEQISEVSWAGNPDKPVVERAGQRLLSPRSSFEKWIEIKRGYSRAWTAEQKMVATKFRAALLRWL